jgi:hypothetical protein
VSAVEIQKLEDTTFTLEAQLDLLLGERRRLRELEKSVCSQLNDCRVQLATLKSLPAY